MGRVPVSLRSKAQCAGPRFAYVSAIACNSQRFPGVGARSSLSDAGNIVIAFEAGEIVGAGRGGRRRLVLGHIFSKQVLVLIAFLVKQRIVVLGKPLVFLVFGCGKAAAAAALFLLGKLFPFVKLFVGQLILVVKSFVEDAVFFIVFKKRRFFARVVLFVVSEDIVEQTLVDKI